MVSHPKAAEDSRCYWVSLRGVLKGGVGSTNEQGCPLHHYDMHYKYAGFSGERWFNDNKKPLPRSRVCRRTRLAK
jgi:hypothetical protein